MATKFQQKVYELTKKIPKGKVTTYGEIAKKMKIKAYQAVGNALRCNPYAPKVPCHRVIDSKGHLHGFGGKTDSKALNKKKRLLEKEGVVINNNKVDLKKYLFKY